MRIQSLIARARDAARAKIGALLTRFALSKRVAGEVSRDPRRSR